MIRIALVSLTMFIGFATTYANCHAKENGFIYLPDETKYGLYFSATIVFGPDSAPDSIIIPIKRAGNLIILEGIVDGLPGNLILDTGSAALVLNSIYFGDQGRKSAVLAGGITGSTGSTYRSRIKSMQISTMIFNDIDANITDLGHIEKARNIRVLGFFGLSVFQGYEVVVDLMNGVLELHKVNFRGNRITSE
jgi:hypothetical protein